jgi:hypothetical protein
MSHEKRDDIARGKPRGHRSEHGHGHRPEPDFDPDIGFDTDLEADPPRDPALAAAFRELASGAEARPNLERLGDSIRAAAAPRLALRQHPAPWWQYAAGWARGAIPAGLAASVALVLGLRTLAPGARAPDQAPPPAAFEEVLAAIFDEPQGELSFPADGDELLRAALLIED